MDIERLRTFLALRTLGVVALLAVILTSPSSGQETTYKYSGNTYQTIGFVSPAVCPVMVSFTTTQPLPQNSNLQLQGNPILKSFSITNCFNTITDQNQDSFFEFFQIVTDSQGKIKFWFTQATIDQGIAVQVTTSSGYVFTAAQVSIGTVYDPLGVFYGPPNAQVTDRTFYQRQPDYFAAENSNTNSPGAWGGGGWCQVAIPRVGQCDGKPGHWGGETYALSSSSMCALGCATASLSRALVFNGIDTLQLMQGDLANDPGYLNDFMIQVGVGEDYSFPGNSVLPDRTTRDVAGANFHFNQMFDGETDPGLHAFSQTADDLEKIVCGNPSEPPKSKFPQQASPVMVGVTSRVNPKFPGHYVLVTGMQVLGGGGTCAAYVDSAGQCVDFTIDDPYGNPDDPDPNKHPYDNLSQYNNFMIWGFVQDPPDNNSGLDLAVGEGVNVMLVDPAGNRTGVDSTGTTFGEIPGSGYFASAISDEETVGGAGTPLTRTVDVFQPAQGMYIVSLTGLEPGTYSLSLSAYSQDGSKQSFVSQSEPLDPGSTQRYQVVYNPAPGSTLQVTPTFPVFTLNVGSLSPGSIKAGASSTSPVSIGSMNDFNSPVTLTCSVSPTPHLAPICSLNPASVTPPGNGAGTSTLTVATTAATAANTPATDNSSSGPLFAMWLLLPSMLLVSIRTAGSKRRKLANYFLLTLVMAGCLSWVACGSSGGNSGGGGSPGTPSGTYTITITSSASGLTAQTSSVTLTVQ